MKIIDFHTHLDSHWFSQPLLTEEEFIQALDRLGIDKACIFTVMGFYSDTDYHNDELKKAAKAHPNRLIPFATVDPKLGERAVSQLKKRLDDPIFRGIKFHPWLQAFAPSMVRETMKSILQVATEFDVPIIFHDGTPPYSTTFQIAEVARWAPEVNIVLGHSGVSDYTYVAGDLLRDIPNLYGCFCGPQVGHLDYLVDTAGPDKILFGSDFGIEDWKLLAERLDAIMDADLSDEELELILWKNAKKLLRPEI